MKNELYQILIKDLLTRQDRDSAVQDLINGHDNLFITGPCEIPYGQASIIKEYIKKMGIADKPVKIQELLNEAVDLLKKIPVLTLQVATDLPLSSIQRIHIKASKYMKRPFVLDLIIDSRLIGGAIVEYDGHYLDSTVKKKIETMFHKRKKGLGSAE